MKNKISELKNYFSQELSLVSTLDWLKELNDNLLGKKGQLNDILKGLKDLNETERKEVGMLANELKEFIKAESEKKEVEIEHAQYSKIESEEALDVTLAFDSKVKDTFTLFLSLLKYLRIFLSLLVLK